MSDLLAAAAEALGAPEELVRRSAEAKAAATGVSPDDLLAAWAGGQAVPSAAEPPAEALPAEPPVPEPVAADTVPATTLVTEPPADVPTPEAPPAPAPAPPAAAPAAPAPARVGPEEARQHPVVVSVPTAGILERTASAVPGWLGLLFLAVPLFGLLYLASSGEAGECVEGGVVLAVDRASGEVRNCDGSAFEGRGGAGGAAAQFIAVGQEFYAQCTSCHGANGGGGVGPAFAGVMTTFSACEDHVEWVALGSAGFQQAGRSTYGDIAKPVNGGMPAFVASLSDEQLRAVVAFERIRFGAGDPEAVLTDCALLQPEPEDQGEGSGVAGETDEGAAETDVTEPTS